MGHHVRPPAHRSMGMSAPDWGSVQRDCALQCGSTGTSFLRELKYFTAGLQVQQPHRSCRKYPPASWQHQNRAALDFQCLRCLVEQMKTVEGELLARHWASATGMCALWERMLFLPWCGKRAALAVQEVALLTPLLTSSRPRESGFACSLPAIDLSWVHLWLTHFICVQHPCHKFAFQAGNSNNSSTVLLFCTVKEQRS